MKRLLLLFALLCCAATVRAQTPVTLSMYARQQFFDSNGHPLAGGCVFTYQAGTSTPLATYTDASGLFQNSNPLILDASGFGSLWITANAYKFVLFSNGGVNCASGAQQWVIDFVSPPPFLTGNNAFSGNNTFGGTTVFNAAVTLNAGGTFNGTITGSPNFSGNPTFSGNPLFSNNQSFPSGISTDLIDGITVSGLLQILGASGEGLNFVAGNGPAATSGGGVTISSGNGGGGAPGNIGGPMTISTGSATTGNNAGGPLTIQTGNGVGTGAGGTVNFNGGTGGSTAGTGGGLNFSAGGGGAGGNGGNLTLTPGGKGAGGSDGALIFGTPGRIEFQNNTSAVAPTCTSTGLGTGNCTLAPFSTDTSGQIFLNPAGGGVAATGTATLTFHNPMGANGSYCMYGLGNGTGTWGATSSVITSTSGTLTALVIWTDSTGAVTAGQQYLIPYWCRGIF